MKSRLIAVTVLTLWVSFMFAAAFGPRAMEYWRSSDVIQPIPVKVDEIKKPAQTVVEKTQERVEAPPIRPAVVEECPAVEPATIPASVPVAKRKTKLRRLVKKAPPPGPVLVGGQPQ